MNSRRMHSVTPVSLAAVLLGVALLLSACLEGNLTSRGFSHNVAETAVDHPDPELRPRTYAASPEEVFAAVQWVAEHGTRWALANADSEAGTLHAEHTTRVFRFVDDVHITIVETSPGSVTVQIRSASRVGKGDLGQNNFNIQDFYRRLDARLAPHGP